MSTDTGGRGRRPSPEETGEPETLYRLERDRLGRDAARYVDPATAQDLIHDAFVAYLSKPPRAERPLAWLRTVTKNRALNELRRRRAHIPVDEAVADALPSGAERDAVKPLLAEALAELSERDRLVIEARYYRSGSYADVAAAAGISVAHAHLLVHRAVRRLARALVRRLARRHGAAPCIPAIEEVLGITAASEGHPAGPCARCRPVWDEIDALRAPAIVLLPLLAFRRATGALASKLPPLGPSVTSLVPAVVMAVAVSVPVGDLPTMDGAVDRQRPAPVSVEAPSDGARRSPAPAPAARSASAGSAAVSEESPLVEGPADTGVDVEADDEGRARADAHVFGEADGGSVTVCRPLEPCPPEPNEEHP